MTGLQRKALLIGGTLGMACVLAVCTPSGMEMVGDAMVDAGRALTDAADSDAAAQTCAMCSSSGALRVVTADSDQAQLRNGTSDVPFGTNVQLVGGPFVLTGVRDLDFPAARLYIAEGGCEAATDDAVAEVLGRESLHGLHLWVPAGSLLCARVAAVSGNTRLWHTGFVPYD